MRDAQRLALIRFWQLQVAQGESKRQKKKGKAKKARDKARTHLHRPQTRSQDASPVALPGDHGESSSNQPYVQACCLFWESKRVLGSRIRVSRCCIDGNNS